MPYTFKRSPVRVLLDSVISSPTALAAFIMPAAGAALAAPAASALAHPNRHSLRRGVWAALLVSLFTATAAQADTAVRMTLATEQGQGDEVGKVVISETEYGLVFTPELKGMEPGIHGFHVHENAKCDPEEKDGQITLAGAAGGHFDPQKSGKHGFPWGDGHLGDLPALYVDGQGNATNPVLAPRLKSLSDISGRSLMVHKGGDNHSDHPEPLGGGGARVACGVIP